MPLVNYEGDSSDEDEEQQQQNEVQPITVRRLHLPVPAQPPVNKIIDDLDGDDDEIPTESKTSSTLLSNLPKPQDMSSSKDSAYPMELPESELEDIVRGDNKEYAKNIPQLPKPVKRKREGPVKIFIPTIEQDSDEEDKPKRKQPTSKRNCALLNTLPLPMYDEDKPISAIPAVKPSSTTTATTTTPQISSTGLFIPYTLNKKQQQKKTSTAISNSATASTKNDSDAEDDDDDNQTDFLGLTKANQIQISNTDVESVLRETFPKARPIAVEEPVLPNPSSTDFEDLDYEDTTNNQQTMEDDDELLRYLPKSERYKPIKQVHIDSMIGESAKIQLLKNTTEERETMLAQAAIHVPKGEMKKRAQINYLIAKAQHDDLQLRNLWSEQKLTKRQSQAKYGF